MDELNIVFTKIRDVATPERGTPGSAGWDFFVPYEFEPYYVSPHTRVLIPSGIKVIPPKNYALIVYNKSGVAAKRGFDVMACVIDSDYRNEMHLSLLNTTQGELIIKPGEKLVQMILSYVPPSNFIEISHDEYLAHPEYDTIRGEGGFGSTDKK